MNIKLFENKIFRKTLNVFKHSGVFFVAMIIFAIFSSFLPEQYVEVNYEKYSEVKNQEEQVANTYNTLNSEFEAKKNELLEKKENISSENEKMAQQIDALNKELEEMNKEMKELNKK